MNKILPTIADMPEEEQALMNWLLTDLVQLAREKFKEQLANRTDTEIRTGLITLMEYGFFKVEAEGDYLMWFMYQVSTDSWVALPASKIYRERTTK
jgi:hypothetical protein